MPKPAAAAARNVKKIVAKVDHKNRVFTYIPAQLASAAPPLGTQLGNIGVNIAGFVKDLNSKEPGYCYAIDYSANSCFMGHVSGIAFCLFLKIFHPDIFNLLEC